MKKFLLIILSFLLNINILSQSNYVARCEMKINTQNTLSLWYIIYFAKKINKWATLDTLTNNKYKFNLAMATDGSIIEGIECTPKTRENAIIFELTIENRHETLVEKIFSKEFPTYLVSSKDIIISMDQSDSVFVLTKAKLNALTISTNNLTDEQKQILINNLDVNAPELRNNINFSKEVNNNDSAKSEYIIELDIQKPLVNLTGSSIFYEIKGRASTNELNPLNTLEFYLRYQLENYLFIEAGRIGPQKFNKNSIRGNLSFETLIPNLIDLTMGKPRLRLKPYIKVGLGYQQNFYSENPFNNKNGNFLVFLKGYYYIPVMDKFAIIAKCDANYSDKFENSENVLFNYSLIFGYETPLNDLKVLFKVENGKNEINIGEATTYSLGLLLDFIPF